MRRKDSQPPADLLDHRDFLRRLALAMLRDPDLADDAVQDTMVTALEVGARNDAAGPERERPWLAAVLRNVARKRWRTRARRARREAGAASAPPPVAPDILAARAELIRSIGRAVAALPTKQQDVVLLRHYEGLPPRAIAASLDVPVNTVKSRLRLAHARLRAVLEAQDHVAGGWRAILPVAVGLRASDLTAACAGMGAQAADAAGTVAGAVGGIAMKKLAVVACIAILFAGVAAYLVALGPDEPVPGAERATGEVAGSTRPGLSVTNPAPGTSGVEASRPGSPSARSKPAYTGGSGGWPTADALHAVDLLRKTLLPDSIEGVAVARTARVEGGGSAMIWSASGPSRFHERTEKTPHQTVSLGPDGAFLFERLEPGSWYVGVRLADGVLRASMRQHTLPRTEPETPTLILLGSASVHGTVYDADNRPKAGARIHVSFSCPKHKPLQNMHMEMRTDAAGHYDMVRLPGGYGYISVQLEERYYEVGKSQGMALYLAPTERRSMDWGSPTPNATVRGVVRCGGHPIAQAGNHVNDFVVFDPTELSKPTQLAVYDDHGRFEKRLQPGTYRVRVTHPFARWFDPGSSEPSPANVELTRGRSYDVDFAISGAQVAGQILLDGKPAQGATVRIQWSKEGQMLTGSQDTRGGRFSYCGLPPGSYELWATTIRLENLRAGADKEKVPYKSRAVTMVVTDGDYRRVELLLERQ